MPMQKIKVKIKIITLIWFTDGYEMMHKLRGGMEEVP